MTAFSNQVCSVAVASSKSFPDPVTDVARAEQPGEATAILAGGCFWCTEGVFEKFEGVKEVVSGYIGGSAETARYDLVSMGRTGHAEAILIRYDPSVITYGQLLKVFFWVAHDPTQLNRQGNDVGPQYRSAIFYGSEQEKKVADAYIAQLDKAGVYDDPIVTEVVPAGEFHVAEDYHQDYARRNPSNGYIRAVAQPKMRKAEKNFTDSLAQK